MNETLIVLCQDAPWATEGCSRGVDVEAVLQHAGGQLCPKQSSACGILTESGKSLFPPTLSAQSYTSVP